MILAAGVRHTVAYLHTRETRLTINLSNLRTTPTYTFFPCGEHFQALLSCDSHTSTASSTAVASLHADMVLPSLLRLETAVLSDVTRVRAWCSLTPRRGKGREEGLTCLVLGSRLEVSGGSQPYPWHALPVARPREGSLSRLLLLQCHLSKPRGRMDKP